MQALLGKRSHIYDPPDALESELAVRLLGVPITDSNNAVVLQLIVLNSPAGTPRETRQHLLDEMLGMAARCSEVIRRDV